VLPPAGATVYEQMQTLRRDDSLRRLLLREPRGSVACHANLVVPATRDDCDAGFIIMEPTEYPAMSGSNTICTATVLLETGTVDVAYGGMWYAIADAQALGSAIEPDEARDLSLAGERIRAAAREQLACVHPENPEIAGISIVQIAEPWQGVGTVTRNAVVVAP